MKVNESGAIVTSPAPPVEPLANARDVPVASPRDLNNVAAIHGIPGTAPCGRDHRREGFV